MASCTHSASCPLFPLFTLESSLDLWRVNYCADDFARCERYRRARDGRPTPENMLPNGKLLQLAFPPKR
jgi:hypothetical protein